MFLISAPVTLINGFYNPAKLNYSTFFHFFILQEVVQKIF